MHGPGQQVQLAPPSGPGSNSHSGLIDPCNLFCKVGGNFQKYLQRDLLICFAEFEPRN
jgi:hypothetical protein